MSSKSEAYERLVIARKQCNSCQGLLNPANCANGFFDSSEIGPWSKWQGNLDSPILVIGQDWGDVGSFQKQSGKESDTNETNKNLITLLSQIGIKLMPPSQTIGRGEIFLTNAILCLKSGNSQSKVENQWFKNCGTLFLRPLFKVVKPKAILCLGKLAFETVATSYGLSTPKFSDVVNSHRPIDLPSAIKVFPLYQCGRRVLNTFRSWEQQLIDWQSIRL
jgi:DNA polymerase